MQAPILKESLQSVNQWQELHRRGYFAHHRHSKGYPLSTNLSRESISTFVRFTGDDDVLDIGCGYGRVMNAVADHVKSVTGIDVHKALVEKARELLQPKANATIVLGDGTSIPFTDRSFTIVYSCNVMQHLPRCLVAIYVAEAVRVLRPGGTLCIQFRDFAAFPDSPHNIDARKMHEQTIAWKRSEVEALVDGLPIDAHVIDDPPRNLYLVGVAK